SASPAASLLLGAWTWLPAAAKGLLAEIFFFQAEDGIRDFHVTGVQTCALPILCDLDILHRRGAGQEHHRLFLTAAHKTRKSSPRSEERRVGKECRSRWSP